MRRSPERSPRPRASVRGVLTYVLGWGLVAVLVVVVVTALVRDGEEEVALPPIEATDLAVAASEAGCLLRSGPVRESGLEVDGPSGRPAHPAVYDAPGPSARAIVAALRRGTIVIDYRPDLREEIVDDLTALQRAVPRATIVAPNARMRYSVAARTWRRLLACPRLGAQVTDAVRLFRGRYIGSGPDPPR